MLFSAHCLRAHVFEVPYERFVSLGLCCVTRTQIDYHLTHRFGLDRKAFGGGQLFDWMFIHDFRKLCAALENHLEDLFDFTDLTVVLRGDGEAVYNVRYDMTWNHLFTKLPNKMLFPDGLVREYTEKKGKIDYLVSKFIQLRDYRTLYIAAYTMDDGEMGTVEPDLATIVRLRNALAKIRGNNNFSLLYVPVVQKFDNFENVVVLGLPTDPLKKCEGNYALWNMLLSLFPFTLDQMGFDPTGYDRSDYILNR